MKTLRNAYEIRDAIKANGGTYDSHRKVWEMSDEDFAGLMADVEDSGERSNKRDRALFVAFAKVEVE